MLFNLWDGVVDLYFLLCEEVLFNIGLILILGVIGGNIAEKIKLPRVTGYIIIGMLFGPHMLKLIDSHFLYEFKIVKTLALGFIGFNIGMELNKSIIRLQAKKVLFITLFQALVTFILVGTVVYLFVGEHKLTYALLFASIATVTTPAPIVACMRSYKTNGSISDLVCPIVAIDDVIGIILFSLALPFSIYLSGHEGEIITLSNLVLGPVLNIGFSLIVGSVIGFISFAVLKRYKNADNISIVIVIFVAVVIGVSISNVFDTSAILLPVAIGAVLSNSLENTFVDKLKGNTDAIVLPLLLVFFTISGADLKLKYFSLIGGLAVLYIVFRVVGKLLGTTLAAQIVKEESNVQKYLGLTLIPQGGVALEMAILAEIRFLQVANETGMSHFSTIGTTIFTVIITAIIVYKIIGEIVVKWAFKKSGEINYDSHAQPHVV